MTTAVATDDSDTTLYRCSDCGKWSHAKRKPKIHLRFLPHKHNTPTPDPSVIVSYEQGFYNEFDDTGGNNGWWIKCGPFDTYHAFKVD